MEGVLEGLLVMGARMRRKPEGSPEPHQAGFFDMLALAAIHGKEKVLSLLLQKLPWPQLETPNPHHPAWPSWFRQEEFDLLRQVYDNDVDTVLACLASDKLLFTPNLADTECPLLVAVKRGDLHAVQTLIALGVNVDEQGRHGWTPLHAVAQWEHEAIADALLQANASVHARARRTLHFWLGSRPTGDNSVGWTPLHVAAYRGNLAVIKKLLDYGADVHAIEYCGGDEPFQRRTALDMVLIGGVVDFDNLDGYGKRWLHPDRLTAALLLMEHGATFSARVAMAWTKLEVDEIVEIFGEHSSLWDKFVAEDWGDVDEPEPEPMSDYDDYEDYY
ncbi:ankyrin repeat-containing domain protein [Coprinopsis sp. MPI-PUGE-AT-0042]|nr:ankyrin repeat-containing domain protein [Coprinopsis sp. MPI-PUGE-AT-0042]